jgi:hypothetical protein
MYTFGADLFPIVDPLGGSANDIQRRSAGFSSALLVVLLLCLLPSTASSQEAAGNDKSGKQVTVPRVYGVFLPPVPGAPFSGTVEIVSRQKLPDGSVFVLKTVNYIARDSKGRIYNEGRRLVAAAYEKEPLVTNLHIYDPLTGLESNLDPLTRIARQTKLTVPLVPDSASVPDPAAKAPNSSLKQLDLGTRTFKGMVLQGTRQIRGANESTEFWYSPDLSIFISRKHEDPIWEQTVSITDLERAEPDSSLFVVPGGYWIVKAAAPKTAAPSPAVNPAVEILSDTRGVDFGPYMTKAMQATYKSWIPIIPESARPPKNKQGRVGIRFKIYPDGSVKQMILEFPSGDLSLDRAAWGGITGASYPPLPAEFTGPFLELRLAFYYNLDPKKFSP